MEGICNKKNGLYELKAHNLKITMVLVHTKIDTIKL